ncbi:MAG: hypothetical protein RL385_817 [Pseudomonadota bacterium]|jgi:hypothetical protein
MPPRRRVLIFGLRVLGILLAGFVGLGACALGTLLYTATGHAWLARQIERGVNRSICGKLVIDDLVAVDLLKVHAQGVRILDPSGEAAIDVARASIELSARELLAGRAGWVRALVDDGTVRVTEDGRGSLNMTETFRACPRPEGAAAGDDVEGGTDVDLRNIATSGMTLIIGGGSLPSLRMVGLRGIMRVHVLPGGDTELRFDNYSGRFVMGLPTGLLVFDDVTGAVHSAGKQLLHFRGEGTSDGEPVKFSLDIVTSPHTQAVIDAEFIRESDESLATRVFALWTRFSPGLKLRVRTAKQAAPQ